MNGYINAIEDIKGMFKEIERLCVEGYRGNDSSLDAQTASRMPQFYTDQILKLRDSMIAKANNPETGEIVFDMFIKDVIVLKKIGRFSTHWYGLCNVWSAYGWIQSSCYASAINNILHPLESIINPQLKFEFDYDHPYARTYFAAQVLASSLKKDDQSDKLAKRISDLENENIHLRDQIANNHCMIKTLKSKIDTIEHKHTSELIKYDYDQIKERLDPIRSELKMAHRIFSRVIRTRYKTPIAIAVSISK